MNPSTILARHGLFGLGAVLLLLLAGCSASSEAEPPTRGGVTHVRIEGELDVGNLALLSRAIRSAEAAGHTTLLLELDTPGGALDVLWKIQKQMQQAETDGLEIATWIHDHAVSAGTLVALCSARVYMSSEGTIGSAMPVMIGIGGLERLPDEVREKETSFLRSQFASAAEKHGRPAALAMAMVDLDVEVRQVKIDGELKLVTGDEWNTLREAGRPYELVRTIQPRGKLLNLTAREAVELRFVDGLADTLPQVLDKLGLADQRPSARLERSNAENVVAWLERFTPILLLLGIVLAYLELKVPGFGLPGILSIVCFVLLIAGQYLAGLADIPHIVAVGVGAALVAVEVFLLPGTLWLGITGLLLVVGGLVLGSVGPGFDWQSGFDQQLVLDAAFRIVAAAAVALVLVLVLSRYLPQTPVLRRMVLAPSHEVAAFGGAMPEATGSAASAARVGAVGRVVTDLRPVGKVELDLNPGHEYEARSVGPLFTRGARVRVVEVSAARLVVEGAAEAGAS